MPRRDDPERFLFRYEDDEREPLQLRYTWEICDACRGEGKSSAYLGAITAEDWDRDWDYEERDAYLKGTYDRRCDECNGTGKYKMVDDEWFEREHPTEFVVWIQACEDDAAYERMCEEERRMGA